MSKQIREPCIECRRFSSCLERRGINCESFEKRKPRQSVSHKNKRGGVDDY